MRADIGRHRPTCSHFRHNRTKCCRAQAALYSPPAGLASGGAAFAARCAKGGPQAPSAIPRATGTGPCGWWLGRGPLRLTPTTHCLGYDRVPLTLQRHLRILKEFRQPGGLSRWSEAGPSAPAGVFAQAPAYASAALMRKSIKQRERGWGWRCVAGLSTHSFFIGSQSGRQVGRRGMANNGWAGITVHCNTRSLVSPRATRAHRLFRCSTRGMHAAPSCCPGPAGPPFGPQGSNCGGLGKGGTAGQKAEAVGWRRRVGVELAYLYTKPRLCTSARRTVSLEPVAYSKR